MSLQPFEHCLVFIFTPTGFVLVGQKIIIIIQKFILRTLSMNRRHKLCTLRAVFTFW